MTLYDNRWFRYDDPDAFIVLVNKSPYPIAKGSEITINRGKKLNSWLL